MSSFYWTKPVPRPFFLPNGVIGKSQGKTSVVESTWHSLATVAKGVYIVMCCLAGEELHAHVPQDELAIKSGCSRASVVRAVKILQQVGLIETSGLSVNFSGVRCYEYRLARMEGQKQIKINSLLIEGGAWSLLCHTARALFPVMKFFEVPKVPGVFFQKDRLILGPGSPYELYRYTFCQAAPQVLCTFAGMGVRSFQKALRQLCELKVVLPVEKMPGCWGIPVDEIAVFSPDKLNASIRSKRKF